MRRSQKWVSNREYIRHTVLLSTQLLALIDNLDPYLSEGDCEEEAEGANNMEYTRHTLLLTQLLAHIDNLDPYLIEGDCEEEAEGANNREYTRHTLLLTQLLAHELPTEEQSPGIGKVHP